MRIGDIVTFTDKVFEPPYAPHYATYRGHVFRIVTYHHNRSHLELCCISDPTIIVNGYVHLDVVQKQRAASGGNGA